MSLPIIQPFPQFFDLKGTPLDNGYVYIGVAGDNPETAPLSMYWDSALTQPVTPPLRTTNGYIVRNGAPSTVFIDADEFSCSTKNSAGASVLYSPNVSTVSVASVAAAAASALAAAASATAAAASAVAAAASASGILTEAELEDYLAKMRVPVGTIIPMAQATVPFGYLECNGAPVSRISYSMLFSSIGTVYGNGDGVNTFNVPDLRGEFVRGWDHGRAIDIGRALGSTQSSQNLAHEHSLQIVQTTAGGVGTVAMDRRDSASGGSATMDANNKALSSGGTEARPRNVALMYVIKAFDAVVNTIEPNYNKAPVTVTTSLGGVLNFDLSLSNYFTVTLSENVTSITFTNLPGAGFGTTLMIRITQGGLPYTVAWPAAFRWEGMAPSVSTSGAAVDILALSTFDNGAIWDASFSKGRA